MSISIRALASYSMLAACFSLLPLQVVAHARWVLPSHTILSGDKALNVSLDYSISNAIFHPDIAMGGTALNPGETISDSQPMQKMLAATRAQITSPTNQVKILDSVNLGRKSSTYFTVDQNGTYRVDIFQPAIQVTLFKDSKGERGRLFGTLAKVKSKLPEGASEIHEQTYHHHLQTFVTRNQMSKNTVTPTGKGLEIKFSTHPNELFSGEKTNFSLVLDGKPIVSKTTATNITITAAGTRFRNDRGAIKPKIHQGQLSITWPHAGMYLIEIEHEAQTASATDVHALLLTVEVQPQ